MKIFGIILGIVAVLALGFGLYTISRPSVDETEPVPDEPVTATTTEDASADEMEDGRGPETVIGTSVEGNGIIAYHFGDGDTELLFVGGIHGGYSWNTVLVAYELMDYLEQNTETIPENITVTVIPVLNPDGLEQVVGSTGRFDAADVPASESTRIAGRFNANDVDLNRNFDCEWAPESAWQNRTVSGGAAPFSEPEAAAFRDYVDEHEPAAAVVWYSAAGGVFASNCGAGVSSETRALTNLYADAAGYRAYESFDFYDITGDMVNWLAKENIPAVSVLLTTHEDIEWPENRAGIEAMFDRYGDVDDEEDNDLEVN